MLGHRIENLLAPTINYFESNEPNFFPDIYQMTEQTSNFENIINEMKVNTKKKISLKACYNTNCVNTFYGSFNNKGINKSLIGLNDTNANNKTSMSIYGEKIKTTRENKLFNSRIKEIGCNSTLICPTNNFKDKSDVEL